jgi:voltage-gated sodium channel
MSYFHAYLLMLRTFRLVRTLRLASRIQELRDLAVSLIDAIPKVLALGLLMLLMFFTFAVIFTDMFKDLYANGWTSEDYFSRLDRTFFTLVSSFLMIELCRRRKKSVY